MKVFLILAGFYACFHECHSDFTCLAGWVKHAASCYHFSHDEETWADALIICQQLGGHLVDVNDAVENTWLLGQIKPIGKVFWMDLSDIQVEGSWVWMYTKTNLTFSSWGQGEPNNVHGVENCAELHYSGYWNDNLCKTPQRYVCEMDGGEAIDGVLVG